MSDQHDGLSELFDRYRAACPDREPGPAFMPGVWQRIEARRSFASRVRIYARGFVTVAAAICLAIGIFGSTFTSSSNPVYTETYVEALDNAESTESLAYADVLPAEYRRE
jgi:hypothetical protein